MLSSLCLFTSMNASRSRMSNRQSVSSLSATYCSLPSSVAHQFAPVFHRAVGGQHGAGALVAAHDGSRITLPSAWTCRASATEVGATQTWTRGLARHQPTKLSSMKLRVFGICPALTSWQNLPKVFLHSDD